MALPQAVKSAYSTIMVHTPDPPFEHCQPGISLDELAEAYAQAMGTVSKAGPEPVDAGGEAQAREQPAESPTEPEPEAPGADDDSCPIGPQSILEAMLFVGNREGRPLPAGRAAELMRGVEAHEIPELVEQLNQRYAAEGCPYHVVSETGGYRMTLERAFHPLRNRFYGRAREARLSQAAIEVLAIVAYRQPLSAEQVSTLRGKPSGHVLAQLVHRGLLRIERMGSPRRIAHYYTTDRFLRLFSMKSLGDLPQSEEVG